MRGKGQDWSSSSSFPPHGSSLQIFVSAKEGDEGRAMWQRGGKGKSRECARDISLKGQSQQATCPEGGLCRTTGSLGELSQGLLNQSWRPAPCLTGLGKGWELKMKTEIWT